jgi:hypothetical protein
LKPERVRQPGSASAGRERWLDRSSPFFLVAPWSPPLCRKPGETK